jgi:hypothetical protein
MKWSFAFPSSHQDETVVGARKLERDLQRVQRALRGVLRDVLGEDELHPRHQVIDVSVQTPKLRGDGSILAP